VFRGCFDPALQPLCGFAQDVALLRKTAKAKGMLLRRSAKAKNRGFAAEEEAA
jgi:hypothetical protein